jgi:signal transduction histidine kinase/ActR/RegA family two-component response regulator
VGGDLERRLARLRQGDHLCLIFENPEEPSAALVPFFKTGLAAGDQCLYIGPAAAARRIEHALAQQKIPVGRELERGALVMLTERKRWLPDGRFDPGVMMDLLRQTEQQALDDGFHGLRITWDMDWVLDGAPGAGRLIEYEALLNRFLTGSRTSALCRYDRTSTPASRLESVLHTHPLAVLGEQVCPNSFYEPPEMVLGEPSAEDQVDWMIARLRRARLNEEKLEDLTLRLAQKRAALERADRAKEDLLAMLAHELRNPLGTISNALQVLRLKGEGDETWHRAIEAAERQVLHQALLVDDLLETSRVTRGQIELNCEELDVVDLVRDTVGGYREVLRTAQLDLDLDLPAEPILVFGDRMRLSQALSNLLHNATKFTQPGDRIRVCVGKTANKTAGQRVEITVGDNGVGISPELLPHVFEVFTQADNSLDRARGGLGVGLAVVKGLIDLHGGEVRARSEGTGKGSELTLLLPIATAAPSLPETGASVQDTAVADPDPDAARRILVVEDNPDAAATMRDFLELSGHEVELACSGTDGVRAARRFHPEVVLCDLGLPGMTGFEVAAQLRRDPETASAKLIAVTGYGRDEDRRRSKEAGFDLHLTKPVDPAQLRQVLKTPARQHH